MKIAELSELFSKFSYLFYHPPRNLPVMSITRVVLLTRVTVYIKSFKSQKYFMMKEAYITEKNQWVTLYFTEDDAGEKAADLGTASGMSVSDIDAFWLIPNYGYPLIDRNKVYIKNFRITTLGF